MGNCSCNDSTLICLNYLFLKAEKENSWALEEKNDWVPFFFLDHTLILQNTLYTVSICLLYNDNIIKIL